MEIFGLILIIFSGLALTIDTYLLKHFNEQTSFLFRNLIYLFHIPADWTSGHSADALNTIPAALRDP